MNKTPWEQAQSIIANVNNRDNIYFLEFTADWCFDCRAMQPVISEVIEYFKNNNKVVFINVDAEESGLFRKPNTKYQVLQIPTFAVVKGNNILHLGHNYYPKELLISWIEEAIE